jgi:hypothetical protein
MDAEKAVSKVNVTFRKTSSYNQFPAGGVWCTRTVNGQILCDFYLESEEPPESLVLGISDKGKQVSEEAREFSGDAPGFMRTVLTGVVMTPEVAEIVGQFLVETARDMKKKEGDANE